LATVTKEGGLERALYEKQRSGAVALLEDSQRQRTIGTVLIQRFSHMNACWNATTAVPL
jgi:hypothetical protein